MGKIILFTILLAISLSLLKVASAKTCVKQLIQTYSVYAMNPLTQKVTPAIRTRQSVVFACCEGYREIGRIKQHLECEPICEHPCGHGVCYTPNRCACDSGYMHTYLGTCEIEETTVAQPYTTVAFTEPTIHKKPSFDYNLQPVNKNRFELRPQPTTTHSKPSEKSKTTPTFETTTIRTSTTKIKRRTTTQTCGRCDQGTCISGICHCPPGYKLAQEGVCQYKVLSNCNCPEGHACETGSHECKPLCNGKIYGCIRGTCVAHNQCRCENGTALHKDELFHCTNEDMLREETINWSLYMWLLLIPALLVVMCFYIIIRRWNTAKKNRLEALDDSFSEVRYYNPDSDYSLAGKLQPSSKKCNPTMDEASCSKETIHKNTRVVIINA